MKFKHVFQNFFFEYPTNVKVIIVLTNIYQKFILIHFFKLSIIIIFGAISRYRLYLFLGFCNPSQAQEDKTLKKGYRLYRG
jgi:hypothetical protein